MKVLFSGLLVSIITLTIGTSSAFAWGQNGHRITAEIGERNLNAKANRVLRSIIGNETLAELATWPDDIRSDASWNFSQPWHFLSIDDDESWKGLKRAPAEEGDVELILQILEKFLSDPDSKTMMVNGVVQDRYSKQKQVQKKQIDKRQALAFYVHFVGDIHQPLHVGRRDDFGGNKVQVIWFDEETNSHKVWDELMLESMELSYTELATFLNRASAQERDKWTSSGYLEWAMESKAIRSQVYNFGKQRKDYYLNTSEAPVLGWDYRAKNLPVLRQQLTKGGIRCGEKLNEIFAKHPD